MIDLFEKLEPISNNLICLIKLTEFNDKGRILNEHYKPLSLYEIEINSKKDE